jgi:hypothetical protein
MIPDLVAKGHRILLFSQWQMTLDLLVALVRSLDLKYFRLDGSTLIAERQGMIDEFNKNPDIPIFLITTRAGGMGINLTAADTVILHDLDFNPTMDEQAQDRCHRIGQKKPVTVYKLVTAGTVDKNIYDIQLNKTSVNSAITEDLDGNSKEAKKKTDQEISKLVADALHQFLDNPNQEEAKPAKGSGVTAQSSPSPAKKKAASPVKKAASKAQKNVPIELLDSDEDGDEDKVSDLKATNKTASSVPTPGSPGRRLMSPNRKPSVDKVIELLDSEDEKDEPVDDGDDRSANVTVKKEEEEGEKVKVKEESVPMEEDRDVGENEEQEQDEGKKTVMEQTVPSSPVLSSVAMEDESDQEMDAESEAENEEKKGGEAPQPASAETSKKALLDLSGFDTSDSE